MNTQNQSFALFWQAITCCGLLLSADATPPDYRSLDREQVVDYQPKSNDLLRIWMVYVGQGDGIVIQLPEKYNYIPENDTDPTERIDVLIDGGSFYGTNRSRFEDFVEALYRDKDLVIEHCVITHHDSDHITGLTRLLSKPEVILENIYHNGLASYRSAFFNLNQGVKPSTSEFISAQSGSKYRLMARHDNGVINDESVVESYSDLETRLGADHFHGIYEGLAKRVVRKHDAGTLDSFDRAFSGSDFIFEKEQRTRNTLDAEIGLEVLWPDEELLRYDDPHGTPWSYTVNGNSVTFKLVYKDFSMIFTGDQNNVSQEEWLKTVSAEDLDCDVYKVPHHGSDHVDDAFFSAEGFNPVMSVASMGRRGFLDGWRHPSEDVIKKLKGSHRFYSTYIHEKKFKYDLLVGDEADQMVERSHILIETDGKFFRIVEIPANSDPSVSPTISVPSVRETRRSNCTRWINAKK